MTPSAIDTIRAGQASELFLDYGADAQVCQPGQLEVCDRGMCFRSNWKFEIGTVIAVACVRTTALGKMERVRVEGYVIRCEAEAGEGNRSFKTALAFLSLPEESKEKLREFSSHVAGVGKVEPGWGREDRGSELLCISLTRVERIAKSVAEEVQRE